MLEIEKFIPKENWYVGLLFYEGYFFFKTIRRQGLTVYMPYTFNDGTAILPDGTSGWESPADTQGRMYLEPQEEEVINLFFIGFSPSQSKMYLQYTQREDRMNLITPRPVPGQIGFWDGEMSAYHDPSPITELWTVHDIYPYLNVENAGVSCVAKKISASFWITPYTYQAVKDEAKIKSFLRGEKRCSIKTMGDGSRPIKAPAWLVEDYSEFMVQPESV